MKNIAILSSGSDNSGINSAIRAVVRSARHAKVNVYGVNYGYIGLRDDSMKIITSRDVSGQMGKAGCFLGTGRPENLFDDDASFKKMLSNIEKKKIEGLIVIGGYTSLTQSKKFVDAGIPTVAIPSTIQDDIVGTDICLGVDSAVNNIVKNVERIRSCESTMDRTFLIRCEGETCGSLALRAGIVSGADLILTPEQECKDINVIVDKLQKVYQSGKTQCICLISRGWKPGCEALAEYLSKHENETDLSVRETIFGYVQRGGAPTGFDRLMGTNMGALAFQTLTSGQTAKMTALSDGQYTIVPYEAFLDQQKKLDPKMLELFDLTK